MNPKELRIGNYCKDELTGEWLMVDEITKANDTHVVGFHVINRDKFPLPNGWKASPIELTEDVLDKCKIKFRHSYFIKLLQKEKLNNDIKYLHQLQNLSFTLTGVELEIKL